MATASDTAEVLIMINWAHDILLELVFIALSVFNAVDGCGPQLAFNTVAELFALPIADVAMSLAVALLKIVGGAG